MTNIRTEQYFKSIKEYLNFQRIEDLKTFIKGLSIQQTASVSYFPLIGWVFPLMKNKNNPVCRQHIKQGFAIAIFFLLINVFLNLVNIFTPAEWRTFRFGLVMFIYLLNLLYLVFSVIAIRLVLKNKNFDIRILKQYTDLIQL